VAYTVNHLTQNTFQPAGTDLQNACLRLGIMAPKWTSGHADVSFMSCLRKSPRNLVTWPLAEQMNSKPNQSGAESREVDDSVYANQGLPVSPVYYFWSLKNIFVAIFHIAVYFKVPLRYPHSLRYYFCADW